MTSERMTQILVAVTNGEPPPAEESKDEAEFRQKIEAEVAEIRRKGGIVEIPSEIP